MKFNNVRGFVRNAAGAVVTVATSIGYSLANAAVDISATTTAAKTDVETAGGLIIGVVVAKKGGFMDQEAAFRRCKDATGLDKRLFTRSTAWGKHGKDF